MDPTALAATTPPLDTTLDSTHSSSHLSSNNSSNSNDDEGIAFAAEAAAEAVQAADEAHRRVQEGALVCRICGTGSEEGRPIVRFLPVVHDVNAASAAPSVVSFTQDIVLHVFCGKTASILPTVNQPELEILTKAGLKNKHGIGPEVNAALARTRCAVLTQDGSKEKHFYLVREFEAHLAAIRHTHIRFLNASDTVAAVAEDDPFVAAAAAAAAQSEGLAPVDSHNLFTHPTADDDPTHPDIVVTHDDDDDDLVGLTPPPSTSDVLDLQQHHSELLVPSNQPKITPVRANAGQIQKGGRRESQDLLAIHYNLASGAGGGTDVTEDGKVRCGCGGTHLPTGTPRGASSWRSHIMTKRHQKWMEANGLLGAV